MIDCNGQRVNLNLIIICGYDFLKFSRKITWKSFK